MNMHSMLQLGWCMILGLLQIDRRNSKGKLIGDFTRIGGLGYYRFELLFMHPSDWRKKVKEIQTINFSMNQDLLFSFLSRSQRQIMHVASNDHGFNTYKETHTHLYIYFFVQKEYCVLLYSCIRNNISILCFCMYISIVFLCFFIVAFQKSPVFPGTLQEICRIEILSSHYPNILKFY